MEPSVMPWRVLDAEVTTEQPATATSRRTADGSPTSWRTWWVVAGIAAAAILGVVAVALVVSGPTPVATVQTDTAPVVAGSGAGSGDTNVGAAEMVVHVAGAVRRPGLVRLPAGSRVADAIEAAGGLGPRVDAARLGSELNLAATVADGDRVVVPSRDEAAAGGGAEPGPGGGSGAAGTGSSDGGPIDINHASADALEALPGIGEVTAARIVEARTERPFATVDELLERKVVGPATFAKIRDLVVAR